MAPAGQTLTRTIVVWRGTRPPAVEFERRGLTLKGAEGALRFARALVIDVSESVLDVGDIKQALDHGLEVWILPRTDAQHQAAWNAVNDAGLTDRVTFRTAPEPWEVAERIARSDAPLGEGDVDIEGDVSPEKRFLLKRAFSDCKSVLVQPLSGGFSATAFRVYATFRDSVAGPRPLPFFVKVDTLEKIAKELLNYRIYVDRYIPFYLRPHLDHARCLFGHLYGILVGDFVEYSESLAEVLPRGRGHAAIHSLFDEGLRAWRLQSFQDATGRSTGKIASEIFQFRVDRFDGARVGAARQLGAQNSPADLVQRLSAKECAFRRGPIHGDLHGKNIQVRGSDAILIDFTTTKPGPIVADPASLEVDVAFDSPSDDRDAWRDTMNKLYGLAIEEVPVPADRPTKREYVWNAVRQIRMHALARRLEEHEYQIAVATYLLRRASFPALDAEDEFRRTYAYVLADQIIRSL